MAYRRPYSAVHAITHATCAAALCACGAAGGSDAGDDGGAPGSLSPTGSGAAAGPLFSTPGDGAIPSLSDPAEGPDFGSPAGAGCNELELAFEPRTPTALIVVDRSSSQWDGFPNHTWEPMKAGILRVAERVQDDIRMGVVTYTGQNGGTCPDLFPGIDQLTFATSNLEAVRAGLESVDEPGYKGETPTAATIEAALPALLADPSPGEKVIILVTDGDPDFCDDPDPVCPMDAVVGAVQAAYAQGVTTTVFGLRREGVDLSEPHLRDVANAGVGEPVAQSAQVGRIEDYATRCTQPARGVYSASGGNAQFFQADGNDEAALGDALDSVIYGIRSCIFDLAGTLEIDPEGAPFGRIFIDEQPTLGFGDPNGWQLSSGTQIELLGAACDQLKSPGTRGIRFDFPCEAFILR